MKRYDLLKSITSLLSNIPVICNIGIPSQELYQIKDSHNHFYMLGSMGLCSSIGLGLALSTDQTVLAIDGDGSVLMNLGSIATIANKGPDNYILLILDNGTYGSTGDQVTFTSGETSLAEIARGAGCKRVVECSGEDTKRHLEEALHTEKMTIIVSKIGPGNEKVNIIPLNPIWIRDRFRRYVRNELNKVKNPRHQGVGSLL